MSRTGNDSADRLGVTNRLDPRESIMGGARYMRQMIEMIPKRIAEPDRTWLGLAAYNVGIAHLEDARILTARLKKNPDSWADVKTVLPLLDEPEYFNTLKYGYARGGEPVIFVESLQGLDWRKSSEALGIPSRQRRVSHGFRLYSR